jgi:hypothetical protein
MTLGPYTVVTAMRQDNPAFPKYQIFRAGRFIGVQFSMPCLSDCEWHDRQRGRFADSSAWVDNSEYSERGKQAYIRTTLRKAALAD